MVAALGAALTLVVACGDGDDEESGASATPSPATLGDGDPAGAPEDAPTVAAGSIELAVGASSEVEVEVRGFEAPGLGAWTFDVVYDPAVASATDCAAMPEPAVCNAEFTPNSVRFAGAAGEGLEGDTTLGTITLRCDSEGSTELEVNIDLIADATIGAPQELVANIENGELTCTA